MIAVHEIQNIEVITVPDSKVAAGYEAFPTTLFIHSDNSHSNQEPLNSVSNSNDTDYYNFLNNNEVEGHPVNIFWSLVQGDVKYAEVNAAQIVLEHVEADITGEHSYTLNQAFDPVTQRIRIKFGSGWASDVYRRAIASENNQIPEFERARNLANLKNLLAIEERLNSKERNEQTQFVEFSPTPDLTEESKARGYGDERDSVFMYKLNPDGSIEVNQYWFTKTDLSLYQELLKELAPDSDIVDKKPEELNDVEVLGNGIFIGNDQEKIAKVLNFVRARQDKSHTNFEGLLESLRSQLQEDIAIEFEYLKPIVEQFRNNPDTYIKTTLEGLSQFIYDEQWKVRVALLQKGADTFTPDVSRRLSLAGGSLFAPELARVVGFVATACGLRFGSPKNLFAQQAMYAHPAYELIDSECLFEGGETETTTCEDCGNIFNIKNGLWTDCPKCREIETMVCLN